jgi:tRNA A-37 threonylcarbamoyl transferase component Bud32
MNSATRTPAPPERGVPSGTVRTLKRDGRRGVFLVRTADGLRQVVKRWPATPWEVCKLCLGIAQAQRQLRGARRLLLAGVSTPRPVGGPRITTIGGLAVEIRLDWAEGEPLLDRVRSADEPELRSLGERMGALLARVRSARLFHRDGKLSNFVVAPTGEIIAIDPVGVRTARDEAREFDRSLASLACELTADERTRAAPFLEAARAALLRPR